MAHVMTLKQLRTNLISLAFGSLIVFGVGYHSTVDAIIATVVWVSLVFSLLGLVLMVIALFVIGSTATTGETRKAAAPFYKALSDMNSGVIQRLVSFMLSMYSMYGFIIHEWTGAAVVYVIIIMGTYSFIYLSKDAVKQFFIDSLKGEKA